MYRRVPRGRDAACYGVTRTLRPHLAPLVVITVPLTTLLALDFTSLTDLYPPSCAPPPSPSPRPPSGGCQSVRSLGL